MLRPVYPAVRTQVEGRELRFNTVIAPVQHVGSAPNPVRSLQPRVLRLGLRQDGCRARHDIAGAYTCHFATYSEKAGVKYICG